jgi:hypothetical protein
MYGPKSWADADFTKYIRPSTDYYPNVPHKALRVIVSFHNGSFDEEYAKSPMNAVPLAWGGEFEVDLSTEEDNTEWI